MPSIAPWLTCGLIGPALTVATDLLACSRWRAYRPITQSISVLSAVGAPTRGLVTGLGLVRDSSLALLALGVNRSAPAGGALRKTGRLVLATSAADAAATAFLPRDYGQPTWGRRNAANTLVMAAAVACSIGAMGTGAAALPGGFRVFSATIPMSYAGLTLLALACATGRDPSTAPTGAQERTMAYSYQLWLAGLALVLLRSEARRRSTSLST
jgi:hypothetical protein